MGPRVWQEITYSYQGRRYCALFYWLGFWGGGRGCVVGLAVDPNLFNLQSFCFFYFFFATLSDVLFPVTWWNGVLCIMDVSPRLSSSPSYYIRTLFYAIAATVSSEWVTPCRSEAVTEWTVEFIQITCDVSALFRYGSVIHIRLALCSAAHSDKQIMLHCDSRKNAAPPGGTFPRIISIYVKKKMAAEDVLKLAWRLSDKDSVTSQGWLKTSRDPATVEVTHY